MATSSEHAGGTPLSAATGRPGDPPVSPATSSEHAVDPPLSAPTGRPGDPDWYTRRIELAIYVLAGTTYVVLGVFHKFLLNWIMGPIWLVTWVWLAPALVERVRESRSP